MDERRKRLLYQSCHRGRKEADLILGAFAERHLSDLDEEGLDQFETLLACPDQQIYAWVAGRQVIPEKFDNKIMEMLKKLEIGSETH